MDRALRFLTRLIPYFDDGLFELEQGPAADGLNSWLPVLPAPTFGRDDERELGPIDPASAASKPTGASLIRLPLTPPAITGPRAATTKTASTTGVGVGFS